MTTGAETLAGVHLVDARGHRCPTPTLRLRRALAQAQEGDAVVLIADDPLARIDVPHFLAAEGHELACVEEQAGAFRFSVRKRSGRPSDTNLSATHFSS